MLRTRYLPVAVVLLLIVASAYLYATPYLTARSLRNALASGDADAVERYVNFPALRENLKQQIHAELAMQMAGEDQNPFHGIVKALSSNLATGFVDRLVDSLVTPEGIRLLYAGNDTSSQDTNPGPAEMQGDSSVQNKQPEYGLMYRSLNSFIIVVENEPEGPKLVMTRPGLFSRWEVTAIEGIGSQLGR